VALVGDAAGEVGLLAGELDVVLRALLVLASIMPART
jgi:hypothetical protein